MPTPMSTNPTTMNPVAAARHHGRSREGSRGRSRSTRRTRLPPSIIPRNARSLDRRNRPNKTTIAPPRQRPIPPTNSLTSNPTIRDNVPEVARSIRAAGATACSFVNPPPSSMLAHSCSTYPRFPGNGCCTGSSTRGKRYYDTESQTTPAHVFVQEGFRRLVGLQHPSGRRDDTRTWWQ